MKRLLEFLAFQEVKESRRLQAILACLLFYCFLIFRSWAFQPGLYSTAIEGLNFMPMWPVENLPLRPLMSPQLHQYVFTFLAYTSLAAATLVFVGRYLSFAFLALGFLTSFELLFYVHDLRLVANFFHVHLYLTFFFIFSRQKLIFFRLGLWLVYWLAALVKLTPSWLWGEYFNSVPAKLPLFPSSPAVVTAACLTLLVVEFCSPVCWMSRNKNLRYLTVLVLLFFHVYSGVIVGHWYTTLMTPIVLVALVPFEKPLFSDYQSTRRHKIMWGFWALYFSLGLWNFVIPGDVRTTAEGRYHGLFMFDANRRVFAEIEIRVQGESHRFQVVYDWPRSEVLDWSTSIHHAQGKAPLRPLSSVVRVNGQTLFNPDYFRRNSSRMFGDPYVFYYYLKRVWERFRPEQIRVRLDQQLDGHPYVFRILELDESQIPTLRYNRFSRNEWIRVPDESAPRAYRWR